MQGTNEDFIETLASSAKRLVAQGYYTTQPGLPRSKRSLVKAILNSKRTAIVAEIKFRSPYEGEIKKFRDIEVIARNYEKAGACAVSVLTEPKYFGGSLESLRVVRQCVGLPVLMKDIILDPVQVDSGTKLGADCLLLITTVYTKRLSEFNLEQMIDYVHASGLEVLLEIHDMNEFKLALSTKADLIGINNRDLRTLDVSLKTSEKLLSALQSDRPIVCESGIQTKEQILKLKSLGANAFLIGTALMKSTDPVQTLADFSGE
jgi:indole-3-glycerol phosphate synthase